MKTQVVTLLACFYKMQAMRNTDYGCRLLQNEVWVLYGRNGVALLFAETRRVRECEVAVLHFEQVSYVLGIQACVSHGSKCVRNSLVAEHI